MADFTAAGYRRIRELLQVDWNFLALLDDQGVEVVRVNIATDPRAAYTIGAEQQEMQITLTVEGADPDIPLGHTFVESRIYHAAAGGDPDSVEAFAPFIIGVDEDRLVVRHHLQVPRIAAP